MPSPTEAIYTFMTTLQGLKQIVRFRGQYFWREYPDPATPGGYESVADHTWRLAMLVVSMHEKLAQPIDLEKALLIALIHDIPEIHAGDENPLGADGTGAQTYATEGDLAALRSERELLAAKQIFLSLPDPMGSRLLALWKSYEESDCFEARVVRALDKIEALLQVVEYRQGYMFKPHLEFTLNYWRKYQDVDPAITELGEYLCGKLNTAFREYHPSHQADGVSTNIA